MAVYTRIHASDDERRTSGTPEPSDHIADIVEEKSRDAFARAIGEELRRAREALGWSRVQLSRRLPSDNGDRTILAYEHGIRRLHLQKLVELCVELQVDPGTIVTRGLARAKLYPEHLSLHIDLNALLDDNRGGGTFGPIRQWARNTLNEHPDGIVEIEPAVAQNLALFIGCSHNELAKYLARFTPEVEIREDTSPRAPRRRNAPRIIKTTKRFRGDETSNRRASA